jgi:hypothetical protein
MARQTELLNQLVQAQMNQFHHLSRGRDEHPSAGYQDFLSTQPPLFHKTDKRLDADAWLHTIESKFALLSTPCSDANKVDVPLRTTISIVSHFATSEASITTSGSRGIVPHQCAHRSALVILQKVGMLHWLTGTLSLVLLLTLLVGALVRTLPVVDILSS